MGTTMNRKSTPIAKDLVLVGGGHSQVTVLKGFAMKPLPGVQLTLVCRDVDTPYSGMLPGLVAGHYQFDDAHIDLGPLAEFAGARMVHDEVIGLDPDAKKLIFRTRPPVSYDVVSINIGSTPTLAQVPGAADEVIPVKPIGGFIAHWDRLKNRVLETKGRLRVGVVGAGAGGVELTLAVQQALQHMLQDLDQPSDQLEFHLVGGADTVLPTHNRRVRKKFQRVLSERQVQVWTGRFVEGVQNRRIRFDDGSELELDEILWVTQASAAPWLADSGLAVDPNGFLQVHDTLQSISHPQVFAAGDVASVLSYPREKAGVFAVRQGKPLEENLRRVLQSHPLKPFAPQKKFLSLISTGDRYAIASRGHWSLEGKWVWTWKNWIDQRFMNRYNVLPEMTAEADSRPSGPPTPESALRELSSNAMRCRGCGAKVGATVLNRVLERLQPLRHPSVVGGLDSPDDAAIITVPQGKHLVHSVDFFPAIVEDPYTFGKIAANHSLGDIFAMGAQPQSALALATIPYGLEKKVEETLELLLGGAVEVLNAAETPLVGGHTSEGAELALGFAVNGLVDPERVLEKGGLRAGDQLILTKPIGTGTLFAAHMRLKAKGRWIVAATRSMLQSNQRAAECLLRRGAHACTDVTGFGLLGHLAEMTQASQLGVRLALSSIPLLAGALETVKSGIFSSLHPQNLRLRHAVRNRNILTEYEAAPLIFDPQTAGGLLAGVPSDTARDCLAELKQLGYQEAAIIGSVQEQGSGPESITIEA